MVSPLWAKLRRDARRSKAQFIAVAVTMFLGVTLFAASYDSFQNLQASYAQAATDYRFANLTVTGGDSAAVAEQALATQGVAFTQARASADIPLRVGDTKLLGRVVEVPASGRPAVNRLDVVGGTALAADGRGVLVEEHMADHFGLAAGDHVSILGIDGWVDARVDGIAVSPEYIWPARDRQNILTSPDNFGVVFGPPAIIARLGIAGPSEVAIYYEGGEPDEALTAELTSMARESGAIGAYTRAEQASNSALLEDMRGFEEMAVFFPVLFMAAAAMAAYVTITRLVAAQRPYIGVLFANGFTRARVLRHYLGYGFVPGVLGAVPGAVCGVILARVITGLYTSALSIPVTVIEFYPATLAAAIGVGLLASLVAALAPALVASRVEPAQAMRGEAPTGGGKPSIIERVVPPLRRLPVRWRMVLRGAGRNPRRTGYTMVGVVLSLTLILVSWGMIDTIRNLMNLQFVEIQREDATVYFDEPTDALGVAALTSVDGVAVAEPVLRLPVAISRDGVVYETELVALDSATVLHGFHGADGDWRALPDTGILVGSALEGLLGLSAGDTVSVWIEPLGTTVEETVGGFLDEPLGTLAYISLERAETLAGTPLPVTAALVGYTEGANPDAVRAAITELPGTAAFNDAGALYRVVQDYMVLFYAFVGVMLVFGAAMAFALIFNAMSVNIAERSREMATLLAVGTRRESISRLVTAENLIVAVAGIPPGLVIGYVTSRAAMSSFSSDLFAFDLAMEPATLLWASLSIVIVALVSQWPGLRAIRRLRIATIVKERSA